MLPRKNRLTGRYEYRKVYRDGKKVGNSFFNLFYLKLLDPEEATKVGIVVSKKLVKSSPKRNRLKRIFREIVRINFGKMGSGYWVVINPKLSALNGKYAEINTEFVKTIQKIPFPRAV